MQQKLLNLFTLFSGFKIFILLYTPFKTIFISFNTE